MADNTPNINKEPYVRVMVPSFNNADFISQTLQSLINQNYKNYDINVLDNASTDNTENLINEYIRKSNVSYIKNEKNIGACQNFNNCLNYYKGCDFLAIFHSDDVYDFNILHYEIDYLLNHPEVVAVFTEAKIIDEKNKIIGSFSVPKNLRLKEEYDFNDIFTEFLKNGNSFIICPTFMIKTSVIEEIGIFNCRFGRATDIEMWLRILSKYKIGIIKKKLIYRRMSKINDSTTYHYLRISSSDFFRVINYYLKKNYHNSENNKLLRQYKFQKSFDNLRRSYHLFLLGNFKKSKRLMQKSIGKDTFLAVFSYFNLKKLFKYFLMVIFLCIYKLKLVKFFRKLILNTKYKNININLKY